MKRVWLLLIAVFRCGQKIEFFRLARQRPGRMLSIAEPALRWIATSAMETTKACTCRSRCKPSSYLRLHTLLRLLNKLYKVCLFLFKDTPKFSWYTVTKESGSDQYSVHIFCRFLFFLPHPNGVGGIVFMISSSRPSQNSRKTIEQIWFFEDGNAPSSFWSIANSSIACFWDSISL